MQSVSLASATSPLILAVDIGTSSVRALLFDADAQQVGDSESQTAWELTTTSDGGLVADANELVDLVCQTIDRALERVSSRAAEIAGVGISCFWHSMVGLSENNIPHGPVYMWIDNRSKSHAHELRANEPLAAKMRSETGCRPHSSYWPAKLNWLRDQDIDAFRQVRHWVSFTDYLMLRLTGELSSSICMASGTGLLDIQACAWHEEIAAEFGVRIDWLSPLIDRDQPLVPLLNSYGERWPQLVEVPWYPALGDGAAANVGAGCIGEDRIAMTIGTSAAMRVIVPASASDAPSPTSLWEYRLDREQRVVGGALSNGGNVARWLADLVSSGDMDSLTEQASAIQPDSHGLTWLPFFAGERSPSWNDDAFASLLGMRFSTTRGEIFRAALEGTAYRLASVYDDVKGVAAKHHEIHANGGAALNSPLWMGIIADTFGHPLDAMDADAEVSARGAAISVLNSIGQRPELRPASIESSATFEPNDANWEDYHLARKRQSNYEQAIHLIQSQDTSNET